MCLYIYIYLYECEYYFNTFYVFLYFFVMVFMCVSVCNCIAVCVYECMGLDMLDNGCFHLCVTVLMSMCVFMYVCV